MFIPRHLQNNCLSAALRRGQGDPRLELAALSWAYECQALPPRDPSVLMRVYRALVSLVLLRTPAPFWFAAHVFGAVSDHRVLKKLGSLALKELATKK